MIFASHKKIDAAHLTLVPHLSWTFGLVLAAMIPMHSARAQGADYSVTFTGSSDGTTFDITAGGGITGGPGGGFGSTAGFAESRFGDFLIPGISGISVRAQSGSLNLQDTGGGTGRANEFQPRGNQISFGNNGFSGVIVHLSGGTTTTFSGTLENFLVTSFNIPGVTTFEQLFNPGTFTGARGDYTYDLIFISGLVAPSTATPGGSKAKSQPVTVLVTNSGAIVSAETTGLNSMATTLGNVQNAAQNATRDLNNRIFRARSGKSTGGPALASSLDGTSRYLNFARNQNIDYRVALGLADGEEVDLVDTLSAGSGHPFAMVGVPAVSGSATIAVEGGSGKNSVTDKVVIADSPRSRFMAYTEFDYGFYDQDNLTPTFGGFETDSYAGSVGGEMRLADWLVAGAAYTYLNSDTNSTANLGSSDLEGNLLSGYFTAFHGNTYLDFLYSYGDFNNDIARNTLLGRTAYGDTESHSHNIDINLGHTLQVNERFSFGPSAGFNYTTGEVDGYTERNGGLANLVYPDHEFESMIGRLGGFATFTTDTAVGVLTTQVSAGWAHEFQPENGNVTASLETSPFALVTGNSVSRFGEFTTSEERAHAGTDWLELGATTRLDLNNTGFHLELGYQGQFFRNNASGHFGSAKVGYEW